MVKSKLVPQSLRTKELQRSSPLPESQSDFLSDKSVLGPGRGKGLRRRQSRSHLQNEDINIGKQEQTKHYQGLEHPNTRGGLNKQYRPKPKTAMARIA